MVALSMGQAGVMARLLITTILCLCQREVHGRIKRHMKERHGMPRESTPVKTIQSEDGDVIDCIRIYEQPSLFHPSFKNHEIQMRPRTLPEWEVDKGSRPRSQLKQAWRKRGRCPKGTIPVVKTPVRRRTIERPFVSLNDQVISGTSDPVHEFAAVEGKFHEDYGVFGASAEISVWNPIVLPGEFSCNMVSVASGDASKIQEYISAGWMVQDNLYGDLRTRLFIYWNDANNKGCFDMMCEGFVQVNPNVALGGILPNSTYDGSETFLSIQVYKDLREDWWLQINGELVGYWPNSLFGYLNFWANSTFYGGEIYNTKPGGYHTLTQMGNGHFAGEGYGRSCLISHIQYANGDRKFKRLPDATIIEDRPECYSLVYLDDYLDKFGQFLYNGGPGLSVDCM